jgi:hypothetical protein
MLLVGLIVGALVRDERTLRRSVLLGAAASLLWGIVVGVGAESLLIVVAGTAIGLVNVATGALVGWGLRSALRSIRVHTQPRAPSQ